MKSLKRYALSQIGARFVLATLLTCILIATLYHLGQIKTEYSEQESLYKTLRGELFQLKQGATEGKETMKVWNRIEGKYSDLSGLKIDAAYSLMDELKDQYDKRIFDLHYRFADPKALDSKYETFKVYESEIVIDFDALKDTDALSLIQDIVDKMPGLVQIEALEMSKGKSLGDDFIEKLDVDNPPPVIQVKLRAKWYDLL